MHKLIAILILTVSLCGINGAHAQQDKTKETKAKTQTTVKEGSMQGNTFVVSGSTGKSGKSKITYEPTGKNFSTARGNTYPLYLGSNGSLYTKHTSSKDGHEYYTKRKREEYPDLYKALGL